LNEIKSCSQIDKSDYEEEEQNISKSPNETSNLSMRRRMAKFLLVVKLGNIFFAKENFISSLEISAREAIMVP
jgi:hypothetical protein